MLVNYVKDGDLLGKIVMLFVLLVLRFHIHQVAKQQYLKYHSEYNDTPLFLVLKRFLGLGKV